MIVQDHVGVLQRAQRLEREELRIPGSRTHQCHLARSRPRRGARGEQLLRQTPCAALVALDETARRGSVDEILEITSPCVRMSQAPAAGGPQLSEPRSESSGARGDQRFQPLAQPAREHWRGAAARDGDEHRFAVDEGRYDYARGGAIVDDVHRYRARIGEARDPPIQSAARGRRYGEPGAIQIVGCEFPDRERYASGGGAPLYLGLDARRDHCHEGPRAFKQVHLAQRHLAAADDQHLLPVQIEEERKVPQSSILDAANSGVGDTSAGAYART